MKYVLTFCLFLASATTAYGQTLEQEVAQMKSAVTAALAALDQLEASGGTTKIVEVPLVPKNSTEQALINMLKSVGIRVEVDGNAVGGTYPKWMRDHMASTDGVRGFYHNDYSNGS